MKCFYWRRFRTTVSWHSLRHESFGEGEQALTHGAIDAEEHAQRSRQNIQSAPGSWYTIAHLAEVNHRANTAKHQERPQLTKFTGAWGPEDEEPDPATVLLGVCYKGRQWQDEIELQRQMQEEQQHFNPIRGPRLASNSKADVLWQHQHHIMLADVDSCKEDVDSCLRRCPHAVDGELATRMLTSMPI